VTRISNRLRSSRLRATIGGAAALVLTGGLVAGTMASGPATAATPHRNTRAAASSVVTNNPLGRFLGAVPSTLHRGKTGRAANGTPPLAYHGGPVVHSSKVYTIFWAPSGYYIPPAFQQAVQQYFKDVAAYSYKTGNVYASDTQYYECTWNGSACTGSKNFVSYNVAWGASNKVTTAFPASGCTNYTLGSGTTSTACLTDAQIQTEINTVVSSKGWQTGLGSEVFMFLPSQVAECQVAGGLVSGQCFDPYSYNGFCAYHSSISSPQTLYAVHPWADINGCVETGTPHGYAYPNDDGADPVLNVVSHEHNETITDPLGTGWWDSSGYENGDECAWIVPSSGVSYNGIGDYSQTINSDNYYLQQEWSNRANNCVLKNTYTQPTASFTWSASGTHGEAFTSTASDSDGDTAFTYSWAFGDGGTSTSANPSHTYSAAGTYTVTLTVFDQNGDQAHVSHSVTVS
jgi:PKD domain